MDSTTATGTSGRRALPVWPLVALAILLPGPLAIQPAAADTLPARHAVSITAAPHTSPARDRAPWARALDWPTRALTTIAVDGVWGPATTRALQRSSALPGVPIDGILGPVTIRALQRYLHVTADGVMGPSTIRALQRHLGVTADGVLGSTTVKALQRALNTGSF